MRDPRPADGRAVDGVGQLSCHWPVLERVGVQLVGCLHVHGQLHEGRCWQSRQVPDQLHVGRPPPHAADREDRARRGWTVDRNALAGARCGNFDIFRVMLYTVKFCILLMLYTVNVVHCTLLSNLPVFSAHAHRMLLMGACNPIRCPIHPLYMCCVRAVTVTML